MGKYSFSQYGVIKYGEIENNRVYYNVGITEWSYDYAAIKLEWGSVIIDPADPTITHWKLVKSFSGSPINSEDGILVDGDVISSYRLAYVDETEYPVGQEINYSFWVFNGITWIFCGSASTVAVVETDTLPKLTQWFPRAWLNSNGYIGDATGEVENDDFIKVLSAYAFMYDRLRTEADLLNLTSTYKKIPVSLLKNKVQDLGFDYEPTLGDFSHRSLFRSGALINSLKGTSLGVKVYSTALTHWPTTVSVGHNIMLDYKDSSFEGSIGNWAITGGTLSAEKYATYTPTQTYPTAGFYDVIFPPRRLGFGLVTATGTAPIVLSLPGTAASKIRYGIPVNAGTRYIFTGQVKHLNASGSLVCTISWYNSLGVLISTTTSSTALVTTTSWAQFFSKSDSALNGALAPSNAIYAGVTVTITPTANTNKYLLDNLMFCESSKVLEYEDARKVTVSLEGDKVNSIPNPIFEHGVGGWQTLNATLVQDLSAPTASVVFGTAVAKITATSAARVAFVSDWISVEPGENYAFSIYVSGSARLGRLRIEYSTQQSAEDQTRVLVDENGKYYPTTPYYVESTPVLITNAAQKLSVVSVAPANSLDAGNPLVKVSFYTETAAIGDVFYFDAAYLEANATSTSFFSGDGANVPTNPITDSIFEVDNCRWEVKNRSNYITDPIFELTDASLYVPWVAGSGSTFTRSTTIAPPYGTKTGKIVKTGGGSISTTAYLYEYGAGKDVVFSAYVQGSAGTYTISTGTAGLAVDAGGLQNVASFIIPTADANKWVRIHTTRVLVGSSESSVVCNISLSTGSGTSATFYITGPQLEMGRIPSKFIDPNEAGSVSIVNPNTMSVTPKAYIYLTKAENEHGGRSNYWSNYYDKYSRLYSTLPKVMPVGASWAMVPGNVLYGYTDLESSLIPSASFENNLGTWVGVNSKLIKTVARGTVFDEYCTHGTAFCTVTSATGALFGLSTARIPVESLTGYYVSIAIKPENEDSYGDYTLSVKFYDSFDVQIVNKTSTVGLAVRDRWAYMSVTAPSVDTNGASYAIVTVTCATYNTPAPGQTFHIDRAVFRE